MNKKLLLTLVMTVFFAGTGLAQMKSVNGDLSYGFDSKDIGFGIGLTYDFNSEFDFTGNARYFLAGSNVNYSELNFNAEYGIGEGDKVAGYLVGGLNIGRTSIETGGTKFSDTELGINLGIGGDFYYDDQFDLFGQMKYVFGQNDQIVLTLGTKLKF